MFKLINLNNIFKRLKSTKQNLALDKRKSVHINKALENFDDFYHAIFGIRWKNMRIALLSEHKYIAIVNNFGDVNDVCSSFDTNGAISVKKVIQNNMDRNLSNAKPLASFSEYNLGNKVQSMIKEPDENSKENFICEKKIESQFINSEEIYWKRIVDSDRNSGGLHEYTPAIDIKGKENWIPTSTYYKYYQTEDDFPYQIENETEFRFPDNLLLYAYEFGNCSDFPRPKLCSTGVLSHYLMDGASILPPLLLDIKRGDKVLDACAAPGGKSLLMIQTLYPDLLVCNDISESRINRMRKVFQQYVINFQQNLENKRIVLNKSDARNLNNFDGFDKILVDVPCSNDRHSLMHNDNNIFKSSRIKERLKLPEMQAKLLVNCLRLLRVSGSLVYSTCSLSPVQNDGVVHMALKEVFNEHNVTVKIKNLNFISQVFSDILKFENPTNLKYGQMVIPYLPANYGPMYFSKIIRTA